MISFEAKTNDIILSPLVEDSVKTIIADSVNNTLSLKSHVLLATSGTRQKKSARTMKAVLLKKDAILLSAKAVNDALMTNSKSIWLNCLPRHHIASLGMSARAYLTGSKLIDISSYDKKWSDKEFVDAIYAKSVSHSSLVPTQVYDLVKNQIQAPPSLKCLLVGGGSLCESLFYEARRLGWPLFMTYGMTETASQIATSHYDDITFRDGAPYLKLLEHVQVSIDDDSLLMIKSKSLLSYYLYLEKESLSYENPVKDGYFKTQDSVCLEKSRYLRFLNRHGDEFKISGERVSFRQLNKVFMEEKMRSKLSPTLALYPYKSKREGLVITLLLTKKDASGIKDSDLKSLIKNFNMNVMPYEKIRRLLVVKDSVYTELFKLKKNAVENSILKDIAL